MGKLWVLTQYRRPLWVFSLCVLLLGLSSCSGTESSSGIPLRSFGVYINPESKLVVAVANDVLAKDNKYPESTIGYFTMSGEIAQNVPATCRGEIITESTVIERSFGFDFRLEQQATKESVKQSVFADWRQGLIRFVDCGLLDGEHVSSVSVLPQLKTSFSDRQDKSVWSIIPIFDRWFLGMNPALPVRLPAQLMLAKSGAQSDQSWIKSTNTDPVLVANDVSYDEYFVGYVGQTKSSKWLAIRAGLKVSDTSPVIAVEESSKDDCEVEREILILRKKGECLVQVSVNGSTAGLRVSIAELLPRTTADRPGGNILDIKPLYITFKNGPDNFHDTDGAVAQMISNSLDYMAEQNPGLTPRLDTYMGLPDIQHIQIPMTYEEFAARWTTTFGPLPLYLKQAGLNINLDAQPKPLGSLSKYERTNRIYVALVEGSLPLKKGFGSYHDMPGCGTNENSGVIQHWIRMPDGSTCDWIIKSFNRKSLSDREWDTEVVGHLIARQQMRSNVGCDAAFNKYFSLPVSQMEGSVSRQDDPIAYKYIGEPKPPWVMDGDHNLYFKIKDGPRAGSICDDLAYSPFWSQIANGEQKSDVIAGRSFTDQPDDSTSPQVHVFYVLPKDVKSRDFDVNGTFSDLITSTNEWLFAKGGKRLRFDTYKGKLDATFVRLNETEGQLWMEASDKNKKCGLSPCPTLDTLKSLLVAKGFNAPNKIMLIYFGGATIPSSRIKWPYCVYTVNDRAVVYQVGLIDMISGRPCSGTAKTSLPESENTMGLASFSEIFYLLGARGSTPSSDGNYSTIDPTDLMTKSEGIVRLDPGNDNYWRHGRSNLVDLYNSAFMEPAEPNAVMPVGW